MSAGRWAFHFDARACSGCKACVVACKDKHRLPVGLAWRRVYEVTGGGWTRQGNAWVSDVFAYHLSVGCNHCEHPICMQVCPARAITRRSDGIVLIAAGRCIGCKYCAWACPYDAPQYDPAIGTMTKCTLCADDVDAGRVPACVAACPVRVLDFRKQEDLYAGDGATWLSFPFVPDSVTGPSLTITPHAAADRRPAHIANLDQVRNAEMHERALVGFTLLAQMAVGAFGVAQVTGVGPALQSSPTRWLIPLLMAVALLASLLHLGKPLRAWRALRNLRTSWLSREILSALLFTAGALACSFFPDFQGLTLLTALSGAGLVYSMAKAYAVRTIPVWNTGLTLASFVTTAALLGGLLIAAILPLAGRGSYLALLTMQALAIRAFVVWAIAQALARLWTARLVRQGIARRAGAEWQWLPGLMGLYLALSAAYAPASAALQAIELTAAWGLVLAGEAIARVSFYDARVDSAPGS